MGKKFDITEWLKKDAERQKRVDEMLRKNPLCDRCPCWNPYSGCNMCGR